VDIVIIFLQYTGELYSFVYLLNRENLDIVKKLNRGGESRPH
jgi:hypothetical protein